MEVSAAAANAEDAGLLQYSKTLDSLETKLNNLSTSFQQFYMSLANGGTFGGAIEGITKFIEGLNKLGNFSAIANIAGIISSLRLVGKTAVTTFTTTTSQIKSNVETVFTQIAASMVSKMRAAGRDSSLAVQQGAIEGQQQTKNGVPVVGFNMDTQKGVRWAKGINIAAMAGAGLSLVGTSVAADNAVAGSLMTAAGSVSSYGSQGAMLGAAFGHPVIGAIAGGIIGLFSQLPAFVSAMANQAQEALDKATKNAEEKNLARAQAAEDYRSLESTIENLKKLQAARYDSEEAAQAFADAQKDAAEKFPQLISGYTATGEAIVDVIGGTVDAEDLLIQARKKAAAAALEAAQADLDKANKQATVDSANYEKYAKYTKSTEDYLSETLGISIDKNKTNYTLEDLQKVATAIGDNVKNDSALAELINATFANVKDTKLFAQYRDELSNIFSQAGEEYAYNDKRFGAASDYAILTLAALRASRDYEGQYYGDLRGTNAVQSLKQRVGISASLNDYLAQQNISGQWTKNNTISSLITNAFTSQFFDAQGNLLETYKNLFDAEGNIDTTQITKIAASFIDRYNELLEGLGEERLASLASVIQGIDKGEYTQQELENVLKDYGLTQEQDAEIFGQLIAPITKAIERTKNKIEQSNFEIKNDGDIDSLLNRLPSFVLDSLSSFIVSLENQIKNEKISQSQGDQILREYVDFINSIYSLPISYAQQNTAANIIASGDMTTLIGQYQIQQQLNEALGKQAPQLIQKEGDTWVSKVGTAVDNVILSYQTFADSLATSVETFADVFKNAASGFDFKDAQKIANKTGKRIDEIFTLTDGKWFINNDDISAVLASYDAERADTLSMLKQQQQQDIDNFEAWINIYHDVDRGVLDQDSEKQAYDAAKAAYSTYYEGVKAYWAEKNQQEPSSFDALSIDAREKAIEEYIQVSGEAATNAVTQYYDWLAKEAQKNVETANRANEIAQKAYGGREDYIEAFNVLKNKGGFAGFTPEEVAKIVGQGIITEDQFIADGFGNFNLTYEAYRQALASGAEYIAEQYDIQLANATKQLGESIKSIGKATSLGTATNADWLKIAQDLGFEKVGDRALEALRNFFLAEDFDKVTAQAIADAGGRSIDEVKALWRIFANGIDLGAQDLQKQKLENYAKVLKGELSAADIAAMGGKIGAATANFAYEVEDQITTYIQELLKDASSSFSDKVSSLSSVYKDELDKAYPSFSSPEQIVKNTRLNSSQAAQLRAELNMLFGMEKYKFNDLFTYNANDQTFSLITSNINAAMSELEVFKSTADEQTSAMIDSYIALFQSLSSEALFTNAQSAAETVKKYATSTEMTFKDIQSIYSELGGSLPAADAAAKAAELNKLDPWNRIEALVKIYSDFGIALDESKYTEIVNTVFDSILSTISNAVSKLSSGLSGTLSFSDFQALIDQGFVNASQGRVGYQGVRLTNEGRQQYLTKLYQQASELGGTWGLGEEIWSTLSSSQNKIFDGYVEIEDEIKRVQSELDGLTDKPKRDGLEAYLALLNQVRAAAMFDPNAAEFDFMGQESTDGLTKNFDKFLSSIDSVKSAFSTLQSGGSIGYDQFYNMVDFLDKFANNGQLASALDKKGKTISDFANAVVLSSKEIGKADLGTVAAQLGVSMSEAAQMMGGDMEQGLKAVAEQQIKYLTGLEGMLKALATMDGLNAEAGVAFTFTYDGVENNVEFGKILDTWKDLPDDGKKEFEAAFKETYAVEFNEANANILDLYFGEDSRNKMSMMTKDQVRSWTEYVYSLMDPATSPLYKDGKLISNWENLWKGYFDAGLAAIDTSEYEQMLKDKIKAVFGEVETVTLDGGVKIKYNLENSKITVIDDGGLKEDALRAKINEQLATQGLMLGDKTPLEGGGFEFTIKSIVEPSAEQSLVSATAVEEAKTQLSDVRQQIEDIGKLSVSPTVSITIVGLAALERTASLLAQIGAKGGVSLGSGFLSGGGSNAFTGTIGKAFADGSLGRLRYGAARAQETLVGELGPELAVYDGQYHLLGKNGAEFVKLPDDAIIFNHLQTQGIMRGQMNIRGTMMASGTMNSGPAMAGGNISAALAAVQRAKSVWQGLLNKLTAQDLLGSGGGGGGGGGDKTAVIQDLQEWYNLSRQIANIEQEINNIVAERENIADGGAYLRSLRQQQELLQDQVGIHKILLDYQDKQLQRQADLINNDRIWSKFLTVGEGGLLQYTVGNETNGGKGALQVLDELNKMSAEQQINYLKSIGYTYTDNDGKELKDTELVTKFFEELQKQIDEYDALYDTVHATKQTVEKLKSDIEKINEEVIQNQKDLEKVIYDVIVDAWQKQIDALDEQAKLTKEVNDNYVDGLNDALKLEQERYQQNQQIADRESMQRQLALLRRSGGSASEIASLEKQLDEKLKDEYFDNQQKAIDKIQEANEKQVQQLELQVQLQKEALDYQKENGIIWTKVYDVMAGQKDEILKFIQGNAIDFFSKSTLEQEAMLTDWAKKIGIYTEDRQYQNYSKDAQNKYWATGAVWGNKNLASLKSVFDGLSDADRKEIQNAYVSTYAEAMLRGADETSANEQAAKEMAAQLSNKQKAAEQKPSTPTVETPAPPPEANKNASSKKYHVQYTVYYVDGQTRTGAGSGDTAKAAQAAAEKYAYMKKSPKNNAYPGGAPVRNVVYKRPSYYSEGGLVDYTGPAIVHGTPARPEAFLNAEQTKQIREGLELGSDRGILSNLRSTISELNHAINSIVNNNVSTNEINISNGAIQISVGKLNDKYDIEDVSNDIMNRIVSIASKASNRGVNRR